MPTSGSVIFSLEFGINKAEHAVKSYAAGKGYITMLSNTEQTSEAMEAMSMLSTTNAKQL